MLALPDDQTPAGWGGRLAFSLVNSVLWRRSDDPEDTLDSYGRLVDIAADSGWLPDAETLRVAGKRGPAPARLAMSRAIELREHLFAIFSSLADDEPVPAVSLSRLNEVFGQALSQLQLAPREPGARIDRRSPVDPDLPLLADRDLGRRAADRDRPGPDQAVPRRTLWLGLLRHHAQPVATLVRGQPVRQPRPREALLPAPPRLLILRHPGGSSRRSRRLDHPL